MKISSTQRLDNEDVCAVWLELDNNSYKYLVSGQSSVQTNFSLLVRMLCRLLPAVLLVTNLVIQTALGQEDLSSLEEAIPGVPGEDFPIFGELPSTSFLCDGRLPGYYADPEVRIPWGGREAARLPANWRYCEGRLPNVPHVCGWGAAHPSSHGLPLPLSQRHTFQAPLQSRKSWNFLLTMTLLNFLTFCKNFYFYGLCQSAILRVWLVVQCGLLPRREFLQSKRTSFRMKQNHWNICFSHFRK